jgi:hypothetical protein
VRLLSAIAVSCFLVCASFAEDAQLRARAFQMWSALKRLAFPKSHLLRL